MSWFFRFAWFHLFRGLSDSERHELRMEVLLLRQQIQMLQRTQKRVRFSARDRAFWVLVKRFWPDWKRHCHLVRPETVVRWHRASFRLFWKWKSRVTCPPSAKAERNSLIRRMATDNPTWGAPRIHGELLKLGFRLSQSTVQRLMPKRPPTKVQRQNWRTFLANHRDVIAAMDFLTVPTATFQQLFVLVILRHGRREIAHFNVTPHPTAAWIKQQLREAFPFDEIPKYLIFDREPAFTALKGFVESMGIKPKQISFRSPWQNGAVERMMRTLRKDLLDHVIVFNENHLHRLLKDYVSYYHQDRTHLSLGKDAPRGRPIGPKHSGSAKVIAHRRVGGLHHRYDWKQAA
jgi:putative transposase